MLTPQDIADKGFVKAVFGGYDMAGVDEFLEAVSDGYSALYKENAILKGKLKVLVEKVEEYRSTEDAMRMALLTAQRMGEEITIEANKTRDEMMQKCDLEIKSMMAETSLKLQDEEKRLRLATAETAKFIELSQAVIRKHSEFLDKIEALRPAIGESKQGKAAAAKSSKAAKVASQPPSSQETIPLSTDAPTAPLPTPSSVSQPQEVAEPVSPKNPEDIISGIAEQIGEAVEKITETDVPPSPAPEAPSTAQPPEATLFAVSDASNNDDEVPTAPKPKFDFDDLKFGANFDIEE